MEKKPNIIVFLTDQQRWDTTGVHGNPSGLTPNFDRLAAEGTHFANAFTCQPVCAPARSSIQTGRYATETGVFRNGIAMDAALPTLASVFAQAGYMTGYIGKWHLANKNPVPPEQRGGYRYWLASNLLELTSLPYRTTLYDTDGNEVSLPGHRIDALTDASIRFLADHSSEPFLLFVSHLEPHHQNQYDNYPAPDGYAQRYADPWMPPDLRALGGTAPQHIAGYYGMVKKLDEALGRTLDALKSLSLDDDTIVLFTSDHGCHFKTRNSEYKRSCHEASIRIPSAATGPGFRGGGRVEELFSLIDIAPTLIDAAGLAVPSSMQGRTALPLLSGDVREWPREIYVQISESQVARSVRTARWKYTVVAKERDPYADSRSDTYAEDSLYDLWIDPSELCNLIDYTSHREVAAALRRKLLRKMEEAGEPPARIEEVAPLENPHAKEGLSQWGRNQRRVDSSEIDL